MPPHVNVTGPSQATAAPCQAPIEPKGQTVCAWCRTLLRVGDPRRLKSFGVCDRCRAELERQAGREAGETVVER